MGMFWVLKLLLLYRLCMYNGDYCFLVSNNVNFMKKKKKKKNRLKYLSPKHILVLAIIFPYPVFSSCLFYYTYGVKQICLILFSHLSKIMLVMLTR